MDIVKIIGIGITGAVTAILLKEYKPVFAVCAGIMTAAFLFLSVLSEISYILDVISAVSGSLSISTDYIRILVRIIGISYLTHFGCDICRDAGQNAIAQKINLAGKVMIVAASIPVFTAVLNLLLGILPN